jgi:hypothetical protein
VGKFLSACFSVEIRPFDFALFINVLRLMDCCLYSSEDLIIDPINVINYRIDGHFLLSAKEKIIRLIRTEVRNS